eukprot:RCo039099
MPVKRLGMRWKVLLGVAGVVSVGGVSALVLSRGVPSPPWGPSMPGKVFSGGVSALRGEVEAVVAMPDLTRWKGVEVPRNMEDLEALLTSSGCTRYSPPFTVLREAVTAYGEVEFFATLLPFLVRCVQNAPAQLTSATSDPTATTPFSRARSASKGSAITLLSDAGSVELTRSQCAHVLAAAMLCGWPGRVTDPERHLACCGPEAKGLPSINFDALLSAPPATRANATLSQVAKLGMILGYFEETRRRVASADPRLTERVVFRRTRALPVQWALSGRPLAPLVVHPLGESLTAAKEMLRVDFANRYLGGGVLGPGAVQEEILFACCPEMIVGRLLCPALQDDEAVLILGAEQFSQPVGYGAGLRYGGPHSDPAPSRGLSAVVAVDALD